MSRVVAYIRVSDPRAEEGYSLADQERDLRAWCERHGHELVELLSDPGVSGRIRNRPAVRRLRELLEARAFNLFAAVRVDRLGREARLIQELLGLVRDHHVPIRFVEHGGADTPSERLLVGVLGDVAEYNWSIIRDLTISARLEKARAGRVPAELRIYGYRLIHKWEVAADPALRGRDGELRIHEPEAEVIRLLFGWWAAGRDDQGRAVSLRQSAIRLNALGYRTGKGLPFNLHAVRTLLEQEAYVGRLWWNRHYRVTREDEDGRKRGRNVPRPESDWIAIPVPPIIEPEMWAAVRARRAANPSARTGRPTVDFSLVGVVYCGQCVREDGRPLRACAERGSRASTRPAYVQRRYGCSSRGQQRREACGIRVNAPPLERAVYAWALRVTQPGWLAKLARDHARKAGKQDPRLAERLEAVEGELVELDRREERMLEAVLGGFSAESVAVKLRELTTRRSVLRLQQQELTAALARVPDPGRAADTAEARAEAWHAALLRARDDPPALQLLYQDLLRVYLLPEGRWRVELAPSVLSER